MIGFVSSVEKPFDWVSKWFLTELIVTENPLIKTLFFFRFWWAIKILSTQQSRISEWSDQWLLNFTIDKFILPFILNLKIKIIKREFFCIIAWSGIFQLIENGFFYRRKRWESWFEWNGDPTENSNLFQRYQSHFDLRRFHLHVVFMLFNGQCTNQLACVALLYWGESIDVIIGIWNEKKLKYIFSINCWWRKRSWRFTREMSGRNTTRANLNDMFIGFFKQLVRAWPLPEW